VSDPIKPVNVGLIAGFDGQWRIKRSVGVRKKISKAINTNHLSISTEKGALAQGGN